MDQTESELIDENGSESQSDEQLISRQVQMENGYTYEEVYVDKCNKIDVDKCNNRKSVSIGSGQVIQFNMKIK